ncbi:MAG: PqiC family protein [Pseudomonadota bacterium]
MKNEPKIYKGIVLLAIAVLIAGGCARTQPSRFYLLQSLPVSTTGSSVSLNQQAMAIGIGPVEFPKYLDRPQIVTRTSESELKLSEFNRWAEPLQDNFTRVLAENLATLLPTDRIDIFPFRDNQAITCQVLVEVISFGGDPGGNAVLSAWWTILGEGGNKELITRKSTVSVPASGKEYDAMVSAQSKAVGKLSEEISSAIKAELQKNE